MTQPPEPTTWRIHIEAVPRTTLGRYLVTLRSNTGDTFGGHDQMGWGTWTLRGARRKGERELARKGRDDANVAARQTRVDALLAPYVDDAKRRARP